jgi:hypothetical protein
MEVTSPAKNISTRFSDAHPSPSVTNQSFCVCSNDTLLCGISVRRRRDDTRIGTSNNMTRQNDYTYTATTTKQYSYWRSISYDKVIQLYPDRILSLRIRNWQHSSKSKLWIRHYHVVSKPLKVKSAKVIDCLNHLFGKISSRQSLLTICTSTINEMSG